MSMEPTYEPILLDVELSEEEYFLDMDMAVIVESISGEHYEGAYIVTPKVGEQTVLATNNKVMDNDVTVLEIPYGTVVNLSGGKTAIIGGI